MGIDKPNDDDLERFRSLVDKEHSRLALYRTLVVVSAIIFSIVIALNVFDYNLLSLKENSGTFILNPLDTNKNMTLYITLKSPTLAANNPIQVSVTLHANSDDTHRAPAYRLLLLESSCEGSTMNTDVIPYCQLDLTPVPNSNYEYHAIADNITYTHGGDFNVVMNALNVSPDVSNTQTKGIWNFIHISPNEATNEFRAFKMTLIIGIIATAIGLLTYKPFQKFNANQT